MIYSAQLRKAHSDRMWTTEMMKSLKDEKRRSKASSECLFKVLRLNFSQNQIQTLRHTTRRNLLRKSKNLARVYAKWIKASIRVVQSRPPLQSSSSSTTTKSYISVAHSSDSEQKSDPLIDQMDASRQLNEIRERRREKLFIEINDFPSSAFNA